MNAKTATKTLNRMLDQAEEAKARFGLRLTPQVHTDPVLAADAAKAWGGEMVTVGDGWFWVVTAADYKRMQAYARSK